MMPDISIMDDSGTINLISDDFAAMAIVEDDYSEAYDDEVYEQHSEGFITTECEENSDEESDEQWVPESEVEYSPLVYNTRLRRNAEVLLGDDVEMPDAPSMVEQMCSTDSEGSIRGISLSESTSSIKSCKSYNLEPKADSNRQIIFTMPRGKYFSGSS